MPSIPKHASMPEVGAMLMNTIRANAPSTYQERVPEATQENIREVGNAILQYQATQNDFLNELVNRIAMVLISSKMYENPLRQFKRGVLELGESIEEVFVNLVKAEQFNPSQAESEVFKRRIPDVNAVFHKMNYQNFYPVTISNDQLRQAFLSYRGIEDLIARIVDSLYTSANFDEFLIMKQLIVQAVQDGKFYPITVPAATADNAKAIVTQFKAVSNAMEFMSPKYNPMGVLTYSDKREQILILDTQFDAVVDVEVLASAFNMDKAEFMGQRVLIDDFGALTGVVAALVDRDWFMVFDNFTSFTEIYNAQGLYWNYFYHVWKTFSTSPFKNAVLFTTQSAGITGVTMSPTTATVAKGTEYQFTATVAGTGPYPKWVHWSVTGDQSVKSTVTVDGKLIVAKDEPNTTLTVTAVSGYDATKSASATVTVS